MSEQQSSPGTVSTVNSTEIPVNQAIPPAYQEPAKKASLIQPAYVLSGLLAILLGADWWSSHAEIGSLREEVARRLQSADTASSETKILAKTVQETTKEIQAKV
ncbi:MAG TPA: hypothetical protein VK751_15900, partial [Undibacterium sp.]|nr:hypothetical protein [Undibacterium sp.]